MRINVWDEFWIVTDPIEGQDVTDVCRKTTIQGLRELEVEKNPSIFTDDYEAECDAHARVVGSKLMLLARTHGDIMRTTAEVRFVGDDGKCLLSVPLRPEALKP